MLCSCTGVAYYRRFTGESCIAEFATQYQSYMANRKFCIANCDAIPLNSCLDVSLVHYHDNIVCYDNEIYCSWLHESKLIVNLLTLERIFCDILTCFYKQVETSHMF